VRVRVLAVEVDAELKAAVTPVGRPETPRVTGPVKPSWSPTVMVVLALEESYAVRVAAEGVR
jgi:hypothetical protein